MGIMARKGFIKFIIAREGPAQKMSFLLACCFMRPSGRGGEAYKTRGFKMSSKLISRKERLMKS